MHQPGSGSAPTTATPLGYCHNIAACNTNFFGVADPFSEVVSRPDGNDSRMQQVTYAAGRLWGRSTPPSIRTADRRAPGLPGTSSIRMQQLSVCEVIQELSGRDLTYPAIGVTAEGEDVMAFTASGENLYPSAAFAPIGGEGADNWHVVNGGAGVATDDGFTSYKFDVGDPPRTRWGDYGAAAVDGDSIWIASEYIAHACSYADWLVSPRCGNTRGFYGNWSTRITKMTP